MNKNYLGFLSAVASRNNIRLFGVWIRLLNQELTIYQQIVFRNVIAMVFAIGIIIIGK